MRDRFAVELRRRDHVAAVLGAVARARGYERLAVPAMERASSFTEEVVGVSPWPEWNPAGVFGLEVVDYRDTYAEVAGRTPAVLIPEGTVSVARWLAGRIADDPGLILPLKVFYDLPCYRNEPVDALTDTKLREFSQFGAEVLGASNPAADAEILTFIHDALVAVGVPPGAIRVRINDVGIFAALADECGIGHTTAIDLKEHLDALAECRAGKAPERAADLRRSFERTLAGCGLDGDQAAAWWVMADHRAGRVDDHARAVLKEIAPTRLGALETVRQALATAGMNVAVDLAVVRSHEYYTGLSFEVDVAAAGQSFVEVAGGGRYDKLVGHFLPPGAPQTIPCTGFAFGVERVVAMLAALNVFARPATRVMVDRFDMGTAETLLLPDLATEPVTAYVAARFAASELRAHRRVDIWVGEADEARIDTYAAARGIGEVTRC